MKYMLAVDGKAPSEKAADFLLKLLQEGDFVYVVFVQPELGIIESMGDRNALMQQRSAQADELSARYLEKFQKTPAKDVRFDVYTGDAKELIVQKVGEREIDILVVGHREMGVIQRAVMGSVSEYLVKSAPCSVLVC